MSDPVHSDPAPSGPAVPDPALVAIVDDDLAVRQAMTALMRALGYRAADYASAEAFLAEIDRNPPDALITDLQMPGMGGLELLSRLKPHHAALACIVMTAFPSQASREACKGMGAIAYLVKPADGAAIADLLQAVLPPYTT